MGSAMPLFIANKHREGAAADRVVRMTFSWGLVFEVAQIVWIVGISVFIMLERRSPTATMAWITLVAALPLVGVGVYLLVGPRRLQRKKLRLSLARGRVDRLLREWKAARANLLSLQGQLMRAGAQLGRLPLALAVDTMVGIAAIPPAFSSGWFHWPGNPRTGETGDDAVVAREVEIVATIEDREGLLAFV